jgi:hypothetical protein
MLPNFFKSKRFFLFVSEHPLLELKQLFSLEPSLFEQIFLFKTNKPSTQWQIQQLLQRRLSTSTTSKWFKVLIGAYLSKLNKQNYPSWGETVPRMALWQPNLDNVRRKSCFLKLLLVSNESSMTFFDNPVSFISNNHNNLTITINCLFI